MSKHIHQLQNNLGVVQKRTRTGNAVIKYPRFSEIKYPEKYFHSILQLFLPYRVDSHLKPSQFETFEEFYKSGCVKLVRDLECVKTIVDNNRNKFEANIESMEDVEQYLNKFGLQEDAWALICPETEAQRLECQSEKNVATEDSEDELAIPDLKSDKRDDLGYCIEPHGACLPRKEARGLMRIMNDEQSQVFYTIRQWCIDKVNGGNPKPFHIFLTGGAGTGKSHVIKCIYNESIRLLQRMNHNPDDVSVLLTAPTGVAAFNINGSTLHSALSITTDISLPYKPLGEEKLSTLRNKLATLHILIIDEISMVDQKMMCYIHGRLRQLKQTRTQCAFGNVSILAVGDFYQLPPVKGKSLHHKTVESSLWHDNFKVFELKEIMRQKDDMMFTQLLNKLRVKKKKEKLSDEDTAILKACETGEDMNDALHIYPTNKQVNKYNLQTMHGKCPESMCIEAKDYEKDGSGQLKLREKPLQSERTLCRSLWIGVGARVMLTRNINVSDGLVNGAFATVVGIEMLQDKSGPKCIRVAFDNESVGAK